MLDVMPVRAVVFDLDAFAGPAAAVAELSVDGPCDIGQPQVIKGSIRRYKRYAIEFRGRRDIGKIDGVCQFAGNLDLTFGGEIFRRCNASRRGR